MQFPDATESEINQALEKSQQAFLSYRKISFADRAAFIKNIGAGLEENASDLISITSIETNLAEARLRTELARTIFQLQSYAEAVKNGDWLNCRIDTADPNRSPVKPDLRKTLVPLGPVVVFGASNFPFAYSTAGGDTASALAAGCTVIVKAHPAHPQTSRKVADIIQNAIKRSSIPELVFQHLYGDSFEVGRLLVQHQLTKAVGFTGSLSGGRALFDWANQRAVPIPVFAEMGSANPVFLFPGKLEADAEEVAKRLAASITQSMGQFCTKPGLLIGVAGTAFDKFIDKLVNEVDNFIPSKMLHDGIATSFVDKTTEIQLTKGLKTVTKDNSRGKQPLLMTVDAKTFLSSPKLHEEIFGPYSFPKRLLRIQRPR